MLKLTRQLFFVRPDRAQYMDYYERTLYNHVLGAQDPRSSHGFHCYFVPLRAGGIKTYSNDYNNFTCCHGTGMESHTKFADSIYFYNGSTLYVNLFIPSVLNWSSMGMTVRQDTRFPAQQGTRLTVTGAGAMTLKVRIPYWTQPGASLRVNGAVQSVPLRFTATANGSSVALSPFYDIHGQRYTVYWNVGTVTPPPANVVWYRFDEASGTSAADSFGNGRTGTLSAGASWTAGRAGGAVNLNGSNGYVSLPAGIVNGVADATIAIWVRLDTVTSWSRVFDLGSGTGSYLFLTPRSSGGTARFAITTSGAGGEQQINAPAALPIGVWTHVAVTQAGNLAILYLNGAEVARNASVTLRAGGLGASSQNWLGRSQYSGDPYLDGQLDDFRIYARALSATEVAALAV
jgi:uncharacterized protein